MRILNLDAENSPQLVSRKCIEIALESTKRFVLLGRSAQAPLHPIAYEDPACREVVPCHKQHASIRWSTTLAQSGRSYSRSNAQRRSQSTATDTRQRKIEFSSLRSGLCIMGTCNTMILVRQPRANVACGGVGACRSTWLPAPRCGTGPDAVAKTCEQACSGVRNVGYGGHPGTPSTSSVGQLRCNTEPLATNSSLISIMPEAYYWHCCATVSGLVGYVFLLPGHSDIRTSTTSVNAKDAPDQ